MTPEEKKHYEVSEETHAKIEEMYHKDEVYDNHQGGDEKMLTTTSNIVPTISDGYYGGYGRQGQLLDKSHSTKTNKSKETY